MSYRLAARSKWLMPGSPCFRSHVLTARPMVFGTRLAQPFLNVDASSTFAFLHGKIHSVFVWDSRVPLLLFFPITSPVLQIFQLSSFLTLFVGIYVWPPFWDLLHQGSVCTLRIRLLSGARWTHSPQSAGLPYQGFGSDVFFQVGQYLFLRVCRVVGVCFAWLPRDPPGRMREVVVS